MPSTKSLSASQVLTTPQTLYSLTQKKKINPRMMVRRRIRQERLRVILSANSAMVLLYWDIGQFILDRQKKSGWGARVVDRMAHDLHAAFPDMQGFSPRNLKYMRAFAAAWPGRKIVQEALAQITWYQNLALLEKLEDRETRLCYAQAARVNGWSRDILVLQIEQQAHRRQGKALTNFISTLPPAKSDMAHQVFKSENERERGHTHRSNLGHLLGQVSMRTGAG